MKDWLFLAPIIISAVLSIIVGIIVWRQRPAPGAGTFAVMMVALTVWLLTYLFRFQEDQSPEYYFVLHQIAHSAITFIPTLWLIITLQYKQNRWFLASFRWLGVVLEPFFALLLIWTNPHHHLFWRSYQLVKGPIFPYLTFDRSPIFWGHIIYSYIVITISVALLVKIFSRLSHLYRGQVFVLCIGAVIPWATNLAYFLNLLPNSFFDFTPIMTAFISPFLAWGLFHFRLQNLIPVAYDTVIESMRDGVIVLDARSRVIGINQAALRGLKRRKNEVLGLPAEQVFSPWPELVAQYQGKVEVRAEIVLRNDHHKRYSDLRISPLYDPRGRLNGVVIVLHDITEHIRSEQALQESENRYRVLFEDSADAILIESLDGRILDCNSAACVIYGYTKDEFRRLNVSDIVPTNFTPIMPSIGQGKDFTPATEIFARRKNGEIFPIELRTRIITLEHNDLIIAYIQDITHRKKAESELRKTLAETEALYQTSHALNASEDLQVRLEAAVKSATTALSGNRSLLVTLDFDQEKIQHVITFGQPQEHPETITFSDAIQVLHHAIFREKQALRLVHPDEGSSLYHFPAFLIMPDSGPFIIALLTHQNNSSGIFCIQRDKGQLAFSESDQELVTAMVSQIAVAIENVHLLLAERRQRDRAETLREVASILTRSLDREQVLQLILEQLERVVDYDSASLMLIADDYLSIVAHRKFRSPQQVFAPLKIDNLLHIKAVIDGRSPITIADTSQDPRWKFTDDSEYIRCWMGVPLIGNNQVIGILNVDKEQPGFFTDQNVELTVALANQAVIAINNARLFEAARTRASESDALRATLADISSELELPRLLSAILERATALIHATGGDLGLVDENTQEILIVASHNMDRDYYGTRLAPGEGAMGAVAQSLAPLLINNYHTWEKRSPVYDEWDWHAAMAVPLLVAGRFVGAIGVADKDPKRNFTQSDLHLLHTFAQQAAIAVANARLYQAAKEASERRAVLHHASREIVAARLDPEGIYTAIHQACSKLMPTEAFVITILDEAKDQINAVYLVDRGGRVPPQTISTHLGFSGKVISTGKSLNIPDITNQSPVTRVDRVRFGDLESVRAVLAVPMFLGGKVVGMLSAQCYRPNSYTSEDLYLLEMLASYAAIALENARLFGEVQRLAITDPLTEIYNRRHLFDLGQREFARARRFERPLAVIMIDVDHFKQVNDQYGHAAGDQVLQTLTRELQNHIREVDILGRYGGEEFTIILPETDISAAFQAAERLRKQVEKIQVPVESEFIRVTISLGVSIMRNDTPDLPALIDSADQALYDAKRIGRNRVSTR